MRDRLKGEDLSTLYLDLKDALCLSEAYRRDIEWVDGRRWGDFRQQGPGMFLLEHAYVVLCSGFKNSVVEGFWQDYLRAWRGWEEWQTLPIGAAVQDCNDIFGNKAKNEAIGAACHRMRLLGWDDVVENIGRTGVDALEAWPWIGPITKFHLGRNIGLDVVKPDRHLVRWAEALGYETPLELCEAIGRLTGERVGTVDVVLWRWAEAEGKPSRTPIQDLAEKS